MTRLGSSTAMPLTSFNRRPRRPPSFLISFSALASCPGLIVRITLEVPSRRFERDAISPSSFPYRCCRPERCLLALALLDHSLLLEPGFAATGTANAIRPASTSAAVCHVN